MNHIWIFIFLKERHHLNPTQSKEPKLGSHR